MMGIAAKLGINLAVFLLYTANVTISIPGFMPTLAR